jgi:hypothetical protein
MTASPKLPRGPSIGSSSTSGAAVSDGDGGSSSATAAAAAAAVSPESLLDALDFSTNSRYYSAPAAKEGGIGIDSNDKDGGINNNNEQQKQQQQHDFDPIAFLNQHYYTEQQLITALPTLRSAISTRLTKLDDSLSTTLRHQASLAPQIAADVQHAHSAVHQLASRMHSVKTQALQSESAVIEITRDMKRLDYAKRHLQRTITALKRLHMLLHAAEQLRMAATIDEENGRPIPNYKAAAQLIDATRLLLGHFDGYMNSVPKMRQVRDAIGMINQQLREGVVNLFHEVGFQQQQQEEMEGEEGTSPMVQSALSDACLVIDALGTKSKEEFVTQFISEHLEEYELLYSPFPVKKKKIKGGGGSASTTAGGGSPVKSFKKSTSSLASSQGGDDNDLSSSSNTTTTSSSKTSLDQVENRFAWYRSKLRTLQLKFTNVFPNQWNIYYHLTLSFLERTARHLKFILKKHSATVRIAPFNPNAAKEGGGGGDSSSSTLATPSMVMSASAVTQAASKFGMSVNASAHGGGDAAATAAAVDGLSDGEKAVTALLKALQKTILFEKEMSAWLMRDFGTKFIDPAEEAAKGDDGKKKRGDGDEDDAAVEALEFDDQGRAVAAGSAEGIRIKYERRKRTGGGGGAGPHLQGGGGGPVPQLMGMASVTFDNYMSPYVALEERTMDEQLHAAVSDNTVDNRGAQPVFVSSTNLFIYMKNSITRCTALTKEKTFFLLQRAFQKKLQSYAKVLDKKLPQPQTQIVAKMAASLANIQTGDSMQTTNTVYRIPSGQEVTVCYVIDTCEYCADTVEALEDLIRDKIGSKYQDKIDMSGEEDAFRDVIAKCIRVLVSGLEQRLDTPLKELSRTNWSSFDMVGEESSYVRAIQLTIHPFVTEVRQLIPSSYFRSFCDKFAIAFASTYYRTLTGLKRISEAGTQQLLLDVTTIKSLLLKLPVLEAEKKPGGGGGAASRHSNVVNQSKSLSGASTIAPAMYTKMVNKEFRKLEVMLKLVGSPRDMLVDMFRAQWDCSMNTTMMASDFTTIMTLKGIPRNDHAAMLEQLGVEAVEGGGRVGGDSSTMTVNIQALQEKGSDVAAKVNADLDQMRQRVDRFRNAFR